MNRNTPTPATAPGHKAATAARLLGRQAALTGAGIGRCPYATDRGGPELMLAMNWVRGYRTVTPAGEPAPGGRDTPSPDPAERFTWQPGDITVAPPQPPGPPQGKTWTRAGATLEAKAYNPAQPRDAYGKWLKVGSRVHLNLIVGGGEGTVTAVHPDRRFDVALDDGTAVHKVSGEYLSAIDPPRAPRPPGPATTPTPAPPTPRALTPADQARTDAPREKIADRLTEIRRDAEYDKISRTELAAAENTDRDIARWQAEMLAIADRRPTADGPPPTAPEPDAAAWRGRVAEELRQRLDRIDRQARSAVARSIKPGQTGQAWFQAQVDEAARGGPQYGSVLRQVHQVIVVEAEAAARDAYSDQAVDPVRRLAAETAAAAALKDAADAAAHRVAEQLATLTTKKATAQWQQERVFSARADDVDHGDRAYALAAQLHTLAGGEERPSLHPGIDALPRQDRGYDAENPAVRGIALNDDVTATNPSYGQPRFNINCVHVVNAHELRRRGYATTATPLPESMGDKGRNSQEALDRWRNPDGSRHYRPIVQERTWTDVKREMAAWPDGARGWIRVTWKGRGAGHIFNVEKVGGEIRYVEAQSGQWVKDMDRVRANASPGKAWGVARMDDLEPTDTVLEFVNERGTPPPG